MNFAELGAIAGTLVAVVYPVTESVKTQIKNVKDKKFESVAYFGVGMAVTIGATFLLKNSNILDFQVLKELNATDTAILGTVAGLTLTGGKDFISNIGKGKELGLSLKDELSKLSADEVADVAFETLQEKGVMFAEDLEDEVGEPTTEAMEEINDTDELEE